MALSYMEVRQLTNTDSRYTVFDVHTFSVLKIAVFIVQLLCHVAIRWGGESTNV